MTRLIIHPGAPKTATTTLQHILRWNRARIARRGVGVVIPEDIRGNGLLAPYLAAYRGTGPEDIAAQATDFFRPWIGRHDTVVISEETFCHDFMPSRRFAQGGIDGAEAAARLISQFGFSSVEVVLSIRPQVDLLTSTYTHFVHRHREARNFHHWLRDEVDMARLLWLPAVEAFRARFGADAVRVVPMEGGIAAYLAAMMRALGLNPDELEMSTERVHNPSPSARAVHLCRVMNAEVQSPKKSEEINTFLVDLYPVSEFGKFAANWQMPDRWAALYAQDYAAARD